MLLHYAFAKHPSAWDARGFSYFKHTERS